jgi:uncharacterized protein
MGARKEVTASKHLDKDGRNGLGGGREAEGAHGKIILRANPHFEQRAGGSSRSDPAETGASRRRRARCERERREDRPGPTTRAARQGRYRARRDHRPAGSYRRVHGSATHQRAGGSDCVPVPVRYLLDVNALVALGFLEHEFHARVASWVMSLRKEARYEILTCSITELGFVRVLSQAPQYGLTVAQSKTLLLRLRRQSTVPFAFLADDHDVSLLPAWVKTARQTTDGHLAELAHANGCVLATLDQRIPSSFLIPENGA